MKKQFITAVILAALLATGCGAMTGDSAMTSADTEQAAAETAAEPEEELASASDEKAIAKTSVKETVEEAEEPEEEEEAEESEKETQEEGEAEETDNAEEAGEDEAEEDEAESDDKKDIKALSDKPGTSRSGLKSSDADETESEEETGEEAKKTGPTSAGSKVSDINETDENTSEGSDDEEAEETRRAYSGKPRNSTSKDKEIISDKEESKEEPDEHEYEDEDAGEYINFWDMFDEVSDGEYDNFWDMIYDGEHDDLEEMFYDLEKEEEYGEEFEASEGLVFKSNRDGTCTITGIGTCTDSVLVIPGRSPKDDVVTAIEDGAFENAEGIETIVFENGSIDIGARAFADSSVENILVYNSSLTINEEAFLYCENLSYFCVDGSDVITYPYAFDSAFDDADLIFTDSILLIDDETFVYGGIRSILAADCTFITGEDAFDFCEDIETMEFSDCFVNIGDYAFFCTGNQMEVLFEDCDVIMEKNAFAFSDIINLEINGSTVQIGEDAFDYCEALENIIVRSSILSADPYAFYGCGNQAKVVFENGEITLGKDAFAFADIISLKIIRCEADIGQEAFKSCENLERADISSGNINIGRRAFYHCIGLKEVSLADNASGPHTMIIGENAFEFSGLEKVMLGKGSIEIGRGAFEYCEDLKDVKIRGDLVSVGRNAFSRCHEDLTIHYNDGEYDSKTIQDAVEADDEASPQPDRSSKDQISSGGRQPEEKQSQSGQKSGQQTEQKSDQKSGQTSQPKIQAPRSFNPGGSPGAINPGTISPGAGRKNGS